MPTIVLAWRFKTIYEKHLELGDHSSFWVVSIVCWLGEVKLRWLCFGEIAELWRRISFVQFIGIVFVCNKCGSEHGMGKLSQFLELRYEHWYGKEGWFRNRTMLQGYRIYLKIKIYKIKSLFFLKWSSYFQKVIMISFDFSLFNTTLRFLMLAN